MASDDHAPPFQSSFSDTRDGALTSNDDLESISIRRGDADSDSKDDSEEVGDDDEEDYDASSMHSFTASRLETSVTMVPSRRNNNLNDNPVKIELSKIVKEGGTGCSCNVAPPTATGSVLGAVVKDESMKNTFTNNVQTSGAYTAREETLKREKESGRLKFVCVPNNGVGEHMIWLIG